MVKIIRRMAFLDAVKKAYDKPFWSRVKCLWTEFQDTNPVVAAYAPLAAILCIPLTAVIFYAKIHLNPVAKYFDYINIYRPDDPRVAHIRKDSCLKYSMSVTLDSIHMPGTI